MQSDSSEEMLHEMQANVKQHKQLFDKLSQSVGDEQLDDLIQEFQDAHNVKFIKTSHLPITI
jgi:hypothetical protein